MSLMKQDISRCLRIRRYSTSTYLNEVESSASASNFKPGFRTTSKLVTEYQRKQEQKSDKSRQVDSLKQISQFTRWKSGMTLFRVLANGHKEVDHRKIIQAFKTYERTGDLKSTMHLCNRMKELNVSPHSICVESIIKIVEAKADSLVAQEFYLNLLYSVKSHDIKLNKSTFGLLTGKIRFIKDCFVREAFYETAIGLIQTNEQFKSFKSILDRDHAISCLNDGDMEKAYSKFIELEKRHGLDGFPYDRFVQYLVDRTDGLTEAMGIFHRHAKKLSSMSIIYLLKENIERKNAKGLVEILSYLQQSDHSVSLPISYATRLISLLEGHIEVFPSIIKLFSYSDQLDKQVATALINAIAASKSATESDELLLAEKLTACIEILILQRNLRAKDLPNLGSLISEILQIHGMKHGTALLARVLNDCLRKAPTEEELFRDGILGILMDTALINYLKTKNASEVFTLHGNFRLLSTNANSSTTLELLLAAAERLRNSKKLSYVICECFSNEGFQISKRAYERAIKNQLRGTRYESVFYFLLQMTKSRIPLSRSLISIIDSEFRKIDDRSFEKFRLLDDKSLQVFIRANENFPSDDKLKQTDLAGEARWNYNAEYDIRESRKFMKRWNVDITDEYL